MRNKNIITVLSLLLIGSLSLAEQSNFNRSRVSHTWNSAQMSSGQDVKSSLGTSYRGLMTLQYGYIKNPFKLVDKSGNVLTDVVSDFSRVRLGYGMNINRAWSFGISVPFDNVTSKPFKEGMQHPDIITDPFSQTYSGIGDIEISVRRRLEAISLRWNWALESIVVLPTGDEDSFNKDGDFSVAFRMAFNRYLGRENQVQFYGYVGGRYSKGSRLEVSPLYFPFEAEKRLEFGLGVRSEITKNWGLYSELNGFLSFPFESGQNPIELSIGADVELGKSKLWKAYAGLGLEGLAGDQFSNDERYYFGVKRQLGKLNEAQVAKFKETPYPVYSSSHDALIDSVHSETSLVKKIVGKAKAVYFVTNSAKLSPEGKLEIIDIVSHLIKYSKYIETVDIEGFADSVGAKNKNLRLSQKRAEAVKDILIGYGVPANILKLSFHGERKSQKEVDAFEKYNNRRAEIKIKKLKIKDVKFPKETNGVEQLSVSKSKGSEDISNTYVRHSLFPKPFLLNGHLVKNFTILTEDNLTWGEVSEKIYGVKTYRDILKSLNYNRAPSLGDIIYFPNLTSSDKTAERFYFAKWK